jgi:hypothetical protein
MSSPARHWMAITDPQQNDTDEFQQIHFIVSIEEARNWLKMAMLSVWLMWAGPTAVGCFWYVFGILKGSKWVQLHNITCPAWIHTRLILMSFSKYSLLDPWETAKSVWKLPCFLCNVGWASSGLFWVLFGWWKGPNESIYTLHVTKYGSTKDWYWWVSANTICWIHGETKTVSKWPCCFLMCGLGQFQANNSSVFGMMEGSKWVQLHNTCQVWIHKRMLLMSFSNYSPLDPWESPITVSKLPCFLSGHCQIKQADVGVFGMKEKTKHVQLHIEWPLRIHNRMILMSFSKYISLYP